MHMSRHMMLVITIGIIVIIVAVFLVFGPKEESYYIDKMVQKLQQYGIIVEPVPIERVHITIPNEFDDVYASYNELQKKAGYDLNQYKGKTVWRYSFAVKNIPAESGMVRANVLFYQTRIIGGDVMSTALNGFMYPLNFKITS